jgi:hypothetical protein
MTWARSKRRLRVCNLIVGSLVACFATAYGAPPQPQALILRTTQVDISQPPASGQPRSPIIIYRHFANPGLLGQAKATLATAANLSQSKAASPTPAPNPTQGPSPSAVPISSRLSTPVPTATSFDAMNLFDGGGYAPPDTTVAAGSIFLLEAVNLLATVYDTAGAPLANLDPSACTTNSSIDSVTDPRVLFDAASGRWFISTATFSPISDASWNLLFSTSNDPTLPAWYCLIIPTSSIRNPDGRTGNFPDFPKIGINSDKVVLTGDAFTLITRRFSQTYKFEGTEFVVINKNRLFSGTVAATLFAPNQRDFAIEPAQQLDSTSETLYMAAVNSTATSTLAIDVWAITGVPGGPTLRTKISSLPIATLSIPPNAQQSGTTMLIDTNDDSLLDAVFRDGSPGSLWVSANDACKPPSDSAVRSCLRFINVAIGTGMSIAQDFDYADFGSYYYYPAIRTDSFGNLYAAFTGSSSSSYASAYAALQTAGNANKLTNLSRIRAGDSPYTLSPPRWGDYSGAGVDPDDASTWLGAEYATQLPFFGSIWGTAIAHAQP